MTYDEFKVWWESLTKAARIHLAIQWVAFEYYTTHGVPMSVIEKVVDEVTGEQHETV